MRRDFPPRIRSLRRCCKSVPRRGTTTPPDAFLHLLDLESDLKNPGFMDWRGGDFPPRIRSLRRCLTRTISVLSMSRVLDLFFFVLIFLGTTHVAVAQSHADPAAIDAKVAHIELLLHEWQLNEAKSQAESLLHDYPDLPAVELAAAWVKFHLGQQEQAAELAARAVAVLGPRLQMDPRVAKIQAMARITRGFVSQSSSDGRVLVQFAPGPDEILVPDLMEAIGKTLSVVGKDLGYTPSHPIVAQILPDSAALADATGLTEDQISTSGTIAVCKFTRLLVTSPRITLKGYSYLDTVSHELVHLIISEKTHNHTPIWIHEALAKFEETRWRSTEPLYHHGMEPLRQSRLAKAIENGKLITFEQMHPSMALLPSRQEADLAYSEVYTVAQFLFDKKGYPGIGKLLTLLSQGIEDLDAIERVYGLDKRKFVKTWLRWLKKRKFIKLQGDDFKNTLEEEPGQKSKGEKSLARVKRIDLRDRYHLGQLLRARGKNLAALVEYKKAWTSAGPMHAARWIIGDKLGQVLAAAQRQQEAIEVFEDGLRVYPNDLEAQLHLGILLAKTDAYQAFLHLRRAARLNPFDPRVRGVLASVCKQLSDAGDQREDFSLLASRNKRAFVITSRMGSVAGKQEKKQEGRVDDAASANIRIFTSPWARIWLDGWDTKTTSPLYSLSVRPGFHVVGLWAQCLKKPKLVLVRAQAGQTALVDLKICP